MDRPEERQEIWKRSAFRRSAASSQLTDPEVLQIRETIDRDYWSRAICGAKWR